MSYEKFYVTTPIYYVNDTPHIGHAYTTILADVLARYHRLLEIPTFFLTGTDEHGQKVQQAADARNIDPLKHCDEMVVRFQNLWTKLQITQDDFIRTTEDRHRQVVQEILSDLYARDEIYADEYEGWYCVPCERFFTRKDLADTTCPQCSRELDRLVEQNYFFRMSRYQEWLISYIENNPEFIQPEHRRQETLGFLKQPLADLCISRPKSRTSWGIELPFDSEYVTYVWFDALVNYISAVGYKTDDGMFQRWWPAEYHLIGKDILTTHTVYWPTMLKAMEVEMPRTIFAHGWWLVGQDKMSKSKGNVVDPIEMADQYGVDAFRYYLMAEMRLGQDASFTEDDFAERYDADLANNLGNMMSRVIKMLTRHCDGQIPRRPEAMSEEDRSLQSRVLAAVRAMSGYINTMNIDQAMTEIREVLRESNRYFEKMAPWTLAKQGKQEQLQRVLYNAAETLRIVGGLLFPVMPERMKVLRQSFGISPDVAEKPQLDQLEQWGALEPGKEVEDPGSLFPRSVMRDGGKKGSVEAGAAERTQASRRSDRGVEGVQEITAETFKQVSLKTGEILKAEMVEGSDKLVKLDVDSGEKRRRQLVAGIGKNYTPAELEKKKIVLVANMKPAEVYGVKSEGMLLAATEGKDVKLVTVDGDVANGATVS